MYTCNSTVPGVWPTTTASMSLWHLALCRICVRISCGVRNTSVWLFKPVQNEVGRQ